jgi:hypothetical protein
VSLGAFIKTTKWLRFENPRGHRGCKRPFSFRIHRRGQCRWTLERDPRDRRLINLQRNNCGTDQNRCDGNWIGGKGANIELEHEVVGSLQTDPPERLAKQFIALSAMEFVEEILEIPRRGLFVALQPKQPRNFVIVKFVHFSVG